MECDLTKTAEYQLGRLEARVRLALDYIDKWEPWGKEAFFARETLRSILTSDEQSSGDTK